MNGIPQVKQAVAVQQEDRFTAPRPTFNAPPNAEHITPPTRDNRPAESIVERAKRSPDDKLKELINVSLEKAQAAFNRAQGKPTAPKVREPKKKKETSPAIIPVQFSPADVCDPETFIKRTRAVDYHTPEMKALFFANGGEKYLTAGLSYANAFSNLRSDMMRKVKK